MLIRRTATARQRQGWRWLLPAAAALALLFGGWHMTSVTAQATRLVWSRPVNLSSSPPSSGRPEIVADGYGNVHVFWSEDVGGASILNIPDQLIGTGNTIYYTRWDGGSWTEPVDLLFVDGEAVADYVAATVDKNNRIHLVWTGSTNFYYSTAPADKAGSARYWTAPVVVATGSARTQWESAIVTDGRGGLHIAYATGGSQPGVYHTVSVDGGRNWDPPAKLSVPLDEIESAYSNVKIIADGAGRLHVIWQTNQDDGFGQSIYYARSLDGGKNWSGALRMAHRDPGEYGVTFPWIAAVGEAELHLVYVDGPWHIGRYHRISQDGGATWSEPAHVLQDFEGINGYPILLVDGANQLHWVQTWRTRRQIGGTYYARWLGDSWSPMELVVQEDKALGPGAHWTAATVRLGNDIHVIWNTNFTDRAGEIWHIHAVIPDVVQATPRPVPTATAVPTATPLPTAVLPTVTVATATPEGPAALPPPSLAPDYSPVLIILGPLFGLMAGVLLVWALVRPRS